MRIIANTELSMADIPAVDADWETICEFSRSFNGYVVHGSQENCAEIANARRGDSLTDLRTCLFYERIRWRYRGDEPDDETMKYIRGLVEKISDCVALGQTD